MLQGNDWALADRRLPIQVESSAIVVRLFEGNTWARLLAVEDGEPQPEYRTFALPSPQVPLAADLGGQVRLLGYDIDRDRAPRTERFSIQVTLYWQAQQRMDTSYTVFAQLLDPAGQLAAQTDSIPQGGGYPTIWWLPGEVVVDPLTLEAATDVPLDAGYRLIVGLYDAGSGTRLQVAGTGLDFVELTPVQP